MRLNRSAWTLAQFWLAWSLMLGAAALVSTAMSQSAPALATTTITDTLFHADGTPATGTVLISWPSFSTWAGSSVPAGSTSVAIATDGALSVQLVANANSTPMGSYYTVIYHLDDGSVTREYWVVPVSVGAVAVSTIRSTVLPASVAMQTVSQSYVDTAIAAAVTGHPLDTSPYVLKAGDAMSGPLTLPADPTAPLQASDKNYVDEQITGVAAGVNQKVSLVPQGSQTVVQPAGTELAVNSLNGVQNAGQYVSGAGNNGIANALASSNCTSGCQVLVEQGYPATEQIQPAGLGNQTYVVDNRGGAVAETFLNPSAASSPGFNAARQLTVTGTLDAAAEYAATQNSELFSEGLSIVSNALAGGNNTYPNNVEGQVPYFKSTYTGLQVQGNNYTSGQHVLIASEQNCYGVGDCLLGANFLTSSGGFRDSADEGTHPYDRFFSEDTRVFTGTCASGCATGSTSLNVAATANAGTQGEGRYLVDTNPALAVTAGQIIGGGASTARQPQALFSGTSFPVSTFLETGQTITSQANNITPGTVTVAITTTALPTGFASSTAALPAASGVACLSDVQFPDQRPLNFETAAYSVIDATHLSLTLHRPHASGATIAVGGLCGYGLEQKVDTYNGIRQVFPVIGSDSPASVLYAGGYTSIVGQLNLTSGFLNVNQLIASIARTNNVVTLTTTGSVEPDLNGLTVTISNVADPSYNGTFTVTSTNSGTLTYSSSGPNSTSSGGNVTYGNGSYGMYPMAELLSVYNPATKAVDGLMTVAANNVPWQANDPVEIPHYFQEWVQADEDTITQFTPRATRLQSAGYFYKGVNSVGLIGFQVENYTPTTSYLGNGGTHNAPTDAMKVLGVWNNTMEMEAGEQAVFQVHCNSHGCGRWSSSTNLFELDSSAGVDTINYAPATSTLNFNLRGTGFSFAPQGFTAGTINVSTLNAGTVNGLFSGTISASAAATLPVFGASGSQHQAGVVPDPGGTAGATRFLREDGAWVAPPAASSTSTGTGSSAGSSSADVNAAIAALYGGNGTPIQRNLYNPGQSLLPGDEINASNGVLIAPGGNYFQATDYFVVAGYTSLVSNFSFVANPGSGFAFYDSGKNFISAIAGRITPGTVIPVPANAVYARSSVLTPLPAIPYLGPGPTVPSTVPVYSANYPDAAYVAQLRSTTLPALQGQLNTVQLQADAALPLGRNLFDPNRAVLNGTVFDSYTQTMRVEGCCNVWSGLIPVQPSTAYTLSGQPVINNNTTQGGVFYDVFQNPIASSFFPVTSTYPLTLMSPANAAYLGFPIAKWPVSSVLNGDTTSNPTPLQSVMLTQGASAPATYTPFSIVPSPAAAIAGSLNVNFLSPWAGKTVSILGDSYCYADQWQYALAAYHQMKVKLQDCRVGRTINLATECYGGSFTGTNSGSTSVATAGGACNATVKLNNQPYNDVAQINNGTAGQTLAQDLAGSDLILVELGTNDNYDPTLGTIADGPTVASTYGYLQAFEQGLHAIIPATTRVVFLSPIQVSSTAGNRAAMMAPVTAAIQAVASQYGDTVIDNLHNSPFNPVSDPTLLQSDGIHPLAVPVSTGGPTGFQLYSRWPTLQLNNIPPFN